MARLGELLVAAGLLAVEQVEQALRAQVMWGGRLGTNLIELGFIDLDALSRALGRQHKLPAAQARHFDKADRALQKKFTPDIAERWSCIPLFRVAADKQVVIASIDPLDKKARAIIADDLALEPTQLLAAVAAEQRIRYQLERVYQIPRETRFLRARGPNTPNQKFPVLPVPADSDPDLKLPGDDASGPHARPAGPPPTPAVSERHDSSEIEIDIATEVTPASETPEELDDLTSMVELEVDAEAEATSRIDTRATEAEIAAEAERRGRERRRYLPTLGDPPEPEATGVLARVAIRRVAVDPSEHKSPGELRADARAEARGDTAPGEEKIATFGEAARAIRRSTDRNRVGELIIETIVRFAPTCDAGMMLVVRGEAAISWKAFNRHGPTPPEIAVPFDQPGLVPHAAKHNTTTRGAAADLGPIDLLLARALGRHDDLGDLVVVPIPIGAEVLCLIAVLTGSDMEVAPVETIAGAASSAFARLMRAAGR